MSDYRPSSELMRLGRHEAGTPVPVSEELFTVLSRAQQFAERSGGAFDVTTGPLVRLWREARRSGVLPDSAALDEARRRVGWQKLRLDPERRTVTLAVPGMQLDLGGIAKGHAADEALAVLREHGVDRALIEIGGDVRVGAPPPGEAGWEVEVAYAEAPHRRASLAESAISTSGDTEQFVEIGGRRYSHVVDPRTGLGLTSRVAATVIAPDAFTSDPLSTLLTVLGPEAGRAYAERYHPEARVYLRRVDEL